MRQGTNHLVVAAGLSMALCACGGGGVSSTPAAPLTPTPTPTPTPPPPLPPGPIGLTSDKPFATVSAWSDGSGTVGNFAPNAVAFSYSAATNTYTLQLSDMSIAGQLATIGANGSVSGNQWIKISSTYNELLVGSGPQKQNVGVTLDWPASSNFTYTNFASWDGGCPMGCNLGVFAYGIPTASGDVPVTGSATYAGSVMGSTGRYEGSSFMDVFGSVTLTFDFGAGTLNGNMKPEVMFNGWDSTAIGTYTFRDTVFSKGSTTFSGAFDVPGSSANSSFTGSFTGPGAAELMAQWKAPYVQPGTTSSGTMSGIWIAKKGK